LLNDTSDYNAADLTGEETVPEIFPEKIVCFRGRIYVAFLGLVRFGDKHNTKSFYLQVFAELFCKKHFTPIVKLPVTVLQISANKTTRLRPGSYIVLYAIALG
jgi:hypothetical protein